MPRLKDVAEVINGYPFSSDGFNDSSGTPLIRIRDLADHSPQTFFDGEVPGESIVEPGDLLIGMDGDFNSATWRGPRAALNQRMCKLVARPGLDQRYLSYFVDLPLRAINEITYFTTVKHLSSVDLMNERIPLPPLAEQRAIADYLDAETARIDALIAKKQQLIHLLEERRCSMFESRLHHELADVPSVPVRYVATFSGGITLGGSHGPGERSRRPYLRVANVQDGYLDLDEISEIAVTPAQASRFALQYGDVLMLEGNGNPDNLGRGTIWRGEVPGCLHQNHIHVVRPIASRLLPEFFDLVARSPFTRAQLTGGAGQVSIATLSKSDIADLRIPLPSVNEQRVVVDRVKRELEGIGRLRVSVQRQLDLLAEHRQALITAAVTGEARPHFNRPLRRHASDT